MIHDFLPYIIGGVTITFTVLTYFSTSNDRRRRWQMDNLTAAEKRIKDLEVEKLELQRLYDNSERQRIEYADSYFRLMREKDIKERDQ